MKIIILLLLYIIIIDDDDDDYDHDDAKLMIHSLLFSVQFLDMFQILIFKIQR